ncbi:hypothetical protein ABIA35_007769 [Catenulispora sp. MAP12-49]|uniref:hypothetical protein n=1 Tax=Catenulispora sp. MAP12-49 TaxID=3156302 RepID=UPI0035138E06
MTEQEVFQKQFGALAVTTRAALVFRYREGLPISHVAQLVDRPAGKLEQHLDRVLTELLKSGALVPTDSESSEEVLRRQLEELRGDPALSAFSLVSAVRAKQQERRLFGGWARRGFA